MPRPPAPSQQPDRTTRAVAATYGTHALAYAGVMTSLPTTVARWGLGETALTVILLGSCLLAAGGSVLAGRVAARRGSRAGVGLGLLAQGCGVLAMVGASAAPAPAGTAVLLLGVLAYGLGLGALDAASAMQGVLLERALGRPVLGRLFAVFTAATIASALGVAGSLALTGSTTPALLVVLTAQAAMLLRGRRALIASTPASPDIPSAATSVEGVVGWRVVAPLGFLILAAFTLDAAISTWSTVLLAGSLGAAAAVAPLGYAAYQAAVLGTRLLVDRGTARGGRVRTALPALVLGVAGCVVVAGGSVLPGGVAVTIVGLALAGVATGALVPLAFAAAGQLLPGRSEEVVARVNLFNYAGALSGAVLLGLFAALGQLGPGFLVPAAVLLLALPALRALRPAVLDLRAAAAHPTTDHPTADHPTTDHPTSTNTGLV